MARIPAGEGLGNVVAQPQRAAGMVPGASGEQIGQALGQAAGGMLDQMERQARAQAIADERQRREAEAQRKAAEKAQANARMLATQDDLALLHDDIADGIKTGKIAKDQAGAEWQRLASERVTQAVEGVPQDYRELAQSSLQHRTQVLGRGITKAVTQRDQADTLAAVNQTLEYTQRLYLKDPRAADQLTSATLEQLGPFTGLTSEQVRGAGQKWKELTRYNLATTLVTDARRDNKALDAVSARLAGDEFTDLDPQRRATLSAQIEGYRVANEQRAEVAARRAQAQAEASLRRAEAEYTAAAGLINSGKVLSDAYIESATKKMAGTPFAAAFGEMVKQGPERAAFGSQPLAVMDRTLNGLRAQLNQAGTDPKTEKQIQALQQVRDAAVREYRDDPLPAALERGIIQAIAPLDVSSIAAVRGGLAARAEQAQIVATRTGEPVSPLLKAEAEQVARLVAQLPVEQRATAVAELAQVAGPGTASAIGRQIAPKDKALGLALGLAGSKTTAGRYTSELVLRGAQAIKDKAIKEDNAALTGVRAQVAAEIGNAYLNDEARQAMIDAAVLVNYGLQSEGSGDVQQAVRLATGGITERNGRKVPLPYGVPEAEFNRKLQGLNAAMLAPQLPDGNVYIDGKPMAAEEFAKQVPGAVLLNAGQGRYAVQAGRGVVTNKDARPVILEVR